MTAALALFIAAVVLPVFFGKTRAAPLWLGVQAVALAWVGVAQHGAQGWHAAWAVAEVLALRGLLVPWLLHRALKRRAEPAGDLMPSNLFAWAVAVALVALAFEFGTRGSGGPQALTLGAVAATVVLALLVLATNTAPTAQLVALLFMENAIALFESLQTTAWPLPVHLALGAVYVLTAAVGSALIGVPEGHRAGAASDPQAQPDAATPGVQT